MRDPHNPQAEQMGDPSMVRTLRYQTEAIWPQEHPLFARYTLPTRPRILDVGCGTGELTHRLADRYPTAHVIGVDLLAHHLDFARQRYADYGERVVFRQADAFALSFEKDTFDLCVCRHMVQVVPDPQRVFAEMKRVTKPGGWIHILAEDYGMIFFHPTRFNNADFWRLGPLTFGPQVNSDLQIGRKTYTGLAALGLQDLHVDYLTIDTLRVPRETMIGIWQSWQAGYTEVLAEHTTLSRQEVHDHFEDMVACLRNPQGYAVWHVPIISGRVPT